MWVFALLSSQRHISTVTATKPDGTLDWTETWSGVTGSTPIYCDGSTEAPAADIAVTIDCNATPADPSCAVIGVIPPKLGGDCPVPGGSGYPLGSQVPLGSSGNANAVNNIIYLYQSSAGYQNVVGFLLMTPSGYYGVSNSVDPSFWSVIFATGLFPNLNTDNLTPFAVSGSLSADQVNSILKMYPSGGSGARGSGPCFSSAFIPA